MTRLRATLALAALWLVYAAPGLLSPGLPFFRDTAGTYLPLREYFAQQIRLGRLPGWYPYEGLGEPYVGQIVTATFHPQSLLYLFLTPALALKWTLYLAGLFALVGAYRFARAASASRLAAVGAAAGYAFCGYAVSMTDNPPYLAGVAMLPWIGWAGLRLAIRPTGRHVAVLAICWALLFLGGDLQSFVLVPFILLACWAAVARGIPSPTLPLAPAGGPASASGEGAGGVESKRTSTGGLSGAAFLLPPRKRRPVRRPERGGGLGRGLLSRRPSVRALGAMGAAGVLAALLVCVELAPALVVASGAERTVWHGVSELAYRWALHPWRLPELIAPIRMNGALAYQFGQALAHDARPGWSESLFCGSLVLVAAGLGARLRGTRAFAVLAVVAFWCALGGYGGLLTIVTRVLPWMGLFRFPEKYVSLFVVSLVPLAARGFDDAVQRPRSAAIVLGSVGALLLLLAAACTWTSLAGVPGSVAAQIPGTDEVTRVADVWAAGLVTSGVLLLAGAGLVAARASIARFVPVLAMAEMLVACAGKPALLPESAFHERGPFVEPILATAHPPAPPARVAVDAVALRLPPGAPGEAEDIQCAENHSLRPSMSARYGVESFGINLPGTQLRYEEVLSGSFQGALAHAPLFNGCFAIVNDDARPLGPAKRVATDAKFGLVLDQVPCSARAFLAEAVPVASEAEAVQRVRAGIPLGTIVWEGGPARPRARGTVRWLERQPDELRLEVEADQPAALFVADAFAPGWTAEIDGVRAPIYPANVAARGVDVPAGHHVVTMTYRIPNFATGIALSLAGLLLCCLLLWQPRWLWRQGELH